MLRDLIAYDKLRARAAIGFFPAGRAGDDIVLYTDDRRTEILGRFPMLRQQTDRWRDRPCLSLADFVAPTESSVGDYVGAFVVTAGLGVDELVHQHEAHHDDYSAIMVKVLADRLAEALADYARGGAPALLGLRARRKS